MEQKRKNLSLDFVITKIFFIFVPMTDTIAVIFGMTFVGIIIVCLVWTILSYIAEAMSPNNKLEENIKKFNKKYNK